MSGSVSFNTSEEEKQTTDPFSKTSLSVKERNSPSFGFSHRLSHVLTSHKKTDKLLQTFLHSVQSLSYKDASMCTIKVRAWSHLSCLEGILLFKDASY